jgi:hypothetical protein
MIKKYYLPCSRSNKGLKNLAEVNVIGLKLEEKRALGRMNRS